MAAQTRVTILNTAKRLMALHGYEGLSMRILATECQTGLSSIYHFFSDKDAVLKELFEATNTRLGIIRAGLPVQNNASAMLEQRIRFQFEHIEDVVFVLKYYLHFRPEFLRLDSGYIPSKAYLHIEEVLEFGVQNGEFSIPTDQTAPQSKVITHAINGFLLEYYPDCPKGEALDNVVQTIHAFLLRSLTNKEVSMT